MPWTEHPTDPAAKRVRTAQTNLAAALTKAAPVAAASAFHQQLLSLNESANDRAMATIHKGFAPPAAVRHFFPKDDRHRTYETPLLPGVVVHLLGPPHDEKVIRDMDPPAGQSYLRLSRAAVEANGPPEPFPARWATPHPSPIKGEDEKRIRELGSEAGLAALVALDRAVNGTSLVLLFQIGDAYLLFPGDAQRGTWEKALERFPFGSSAAGSVPVSSVYFRGGHRCERTRWTCGSGCWPPATAGGRRGPWPARSRSASRGCGGSSRPAGRPGG